MRNGKATGSVTSSVDDVNSVPTPLRITKTRRQRPAKDGDVSVGSGSTNQSLPVSIGEADLGLPGMTSSTRNSGQQPAQQSAYANLSFEGDNGSGRQGMPGRDGRGTGGRNGNKQRSADPIRDPVLRNVAIQQQQLRVHIKAQPGTAVHITPTPTPPRGRGQVQLGHPSAPRQGGSRTSGAADSETEI